LFFSVQEKVLDVPVELTPVKTKPQEIILGGDDNKEDAYIAYLRGDEKFLGKYENEHNKFLAAESAMDSHHHERITKVKKAENTLFPFHSDKFLQY